MLERHGCTTERLREVFTAKPPDPKLRDKKGRFKGYTDEQREKLERDVETRTKIQDLISSRLTEHMDTGLNNSPMFRAVDCAWDAQPIVKTRVPLMLYAQGMLDLKACVKDLEGLGCKDQFVIRDSKDEIVGINLPKFVETPINLVRSVINRRHAAQAAKYSNLWPWARFESRDNSEVGKLRGDLMSQLADQMADDFGYRHYVNQGIRRAFLYGFEVDFLQSSWECQYTITEDPDPPPEAATNEKPKMNDEIVKEGLQFVTAHPTRIFYDTAYPLSSLNTDTGCTYVGFWDVVRARDVLKNPKYWNPEDITLSSGQAHLFSTHRQYFTQYYCNIQVPTEPVQSPDDSIDSNDRKNMVGYYGGDKDDIGMVLANFYWRLIPSDWNLGTYPHPVWVRFQVAGYNTVVHAEFFPDCPAIYLGDNQNDDRLVSISLAHELLSYQDQLTNLMTYLLDCIQTDHHKILLLDIDALTPQQRAKIKEEAENKTWFTKTQVIEVSRSQMEELGLDVTKLMQLIETRSTAALDMVFRAILQLMQLLERMIALSPQEQGQPAPREISATETNLIAGTTESVYTRISDQIDEWIAAWKQRIYAFYMAYGRQDLVLPAMGRYTLDVIQKAGFTPQLVDPGDQYDPGRNGVTLLGTKRALAHSYIFTTRDGAERSSNPQAVRILSELLKSVVPIEAFQKKVTQRQFFGMLNELFRMAGVFDLKLEVGEDGDQPLLGGPDQAQQIEQIISTLEQQQQQLSAMGQMLNSLAQAMGPVPAQIPAGPAQSPAPPAYAPQDRPEQEALPPGGVG